MNQVPSYFPRQPQLAHMSNEHSLLHQPTWHTPTTTEAMKIHPHTHILSEMIKNDPLFPRDCVDLSLARNGNQNGELPITPISLSVRDTNKINSLPPSVLDIQAVELTKCISPGVKSASPVLKPASPGLKSASPGLKSASPVLKPVSPGPVEKPVSVIVQPASNFDENSNSSSIVNVPTSTNTKEDDTVSTYSNEDSGDSNKSRRKRKPSKTIRMSKDEEKFEKITPALENTDSTSKEMQPQLETDKEKDPISIVGKMLEENKIPERRRSSDDLEDILPAKTRRKASSESETIDNIAAMVQEGLKARQLKSSEKPIEEEKMNQLRRNPFPNSSITLVTPTQKKPTNPHFVEVENKLEEMFAGIEDSSDPLKTDTLDLDDSKLDDPLLKLDDPLPSTSQEPVTVTSTTEVKKGTSSPKKSKRKSQPSSRRNSDVSLETTPKKKKVGSKKIKTGSGIKSKTKNKKSPTPKPTIRGPRDSPLSVSVVNTPVMDEDAEKKLHKTKKFHDDSEYRHKVRSKGLHCSTLSNKYDAQTKDAFWICAFCKRGPHANDQSGYISNGNLLSPGDLFGPYFITSRCPEFDRRLDDPYDKQFKSKKISRVLDESALKNSGKKSKRKHLETEDPLDLYLGIPKTGNNTYEIWAHEDCIVWSPGTYLVGPKIVGLEEAVWTSCNVKCNTCNLKGANNFCMRRGCLNVAHFCCAKFANWQFIESEFKAYCPEHHVP
ncbi:hypothetical protein NQ317_016611 [Molorchus minor]|uniref:PHD-type domain-containing protein n=1 Tax=Molorchus minor TaxID=1323400 RepID=A0ABQ9IWK9_9CUCU|nr:hypothetical protein NQ317_016611 [Molorchus minor]